MNRLQRKSYLLNQFASNQKTKLIMKNNKYELIIFDCDGTLIDSESTASKAVSQVLQNMGYEKYTPEFCYKSFASVGYDKMLLMLRLDIGQSFDIDYFMKKADEAIRKSIKRNLSPINGAEKLLLAIKGYKKCVASNGYRDYVISSLDSVDLLKFFQDSEIFTYQQVASPKPAPDLFLFAAEQMGVTDVKKCLVIEDSDTGIFAANSAGMDVIAVKVHDNPRLDKISNSQVLGFVSDLTHVLDFL